MVVVVLASNEIFFSLRGFVSSQLEDMRVYYYYVGFYIILVCMLLCLCEFREM